MQRYTGGPTEGVFTDGSASPNPGPGGWGVVWVENNQVVDENSGKDADTTNNRMEYMALIAAYSTIPEGEELTIYTDSDLCVKSMTQWAKGWEKNGWKKKSGPIKNLELVKRLWELVQARPELKLVWIKAHDGSRWNEYADALAGGMD
ncbi:ribonuclease HI [Myxococcota bacterium]|nr:ribonuclease HI [Myxococcota bacterium]